MKDAKRWPRLQRRKDVETLVASLRCKIRRTRAAVLECKVKVLAGERPYPHRYSEPPSQHRLW